MPRAFNLSRWFAAVGLVSIAVLSVASGVLLSRLFTDRMLEQEGVLTMQFMQSILEVERASSYFQDSDRVEAARVEELLQRFALLRDVLRVNLYSRGHKILWSSDRSLVGKSFPGNEDLDAALAGKVQVEAGSTRDAERAKAEHENLPGAGGYFVEIYLPVRDDAGQQVVGAVELYRTPQRLFEAIRAGQRIVWTGAAAAGALLYVALFSLVRRADNLIRAQQDRLVQAETLAAVGEMGSAVAHGIRNPLAAIRSSAELVLESDDQPTREALADIIAEVDRLEQWVRELLTYSRPLAGQAGAGVGVGLPLAKRIVERMGGRISIASRLGAGTTVELLLPTA